MGSKRLFSDSITRHTGGITIGTMHAGALGKTGQQNRTGKQIRWSAYNASKFQKEVS